MANSSPAPSPQQAEHQTAAANARSARSQLGPQVFLSREHPPDQVFLSRAIAERKKWRDQLFRGWACLAQSGRIPPEQRPGVQALMFAARDAWDWLWVSELLVHPFQVANAEDLLDLCRMVQCVQGEIIRELPAALGEETTLVFLFAREGEGLRPLQRWEVLRLARPLSSGPEPPSEADLGTWLAEIRPLLPAEKKWEPPFPLNPPGFLYLVSQIWNLMRALPGIGKPDEPGEVPDHRAFRRELDKVVRWCEQQGEPMDRLRDSSGEGAALKSRSFPTRERPAVRVKPPPEEAWQAWRLRNMLGKTQTDIAATLSQELNRPVDQSKVSRLLRKVRAFLDAGGSPPELPAAKTRTLDPEVINRGRRRDRRTPRQRERAE
ncbi:MAG: hypothetical protein JO112_06940, partial [Planctomycetes bacterium]|nr:hypothetical protein [Planctomycetota bacterium]